MGQNNFILDMIASLKKSQSQKQIKNDIKNLGDFKLPLIGTLNKAKTKAQIKHDLTSLNGTVNLTGKVDSKSIARSVQQATQKAQKTADSQPVDVSFSVKKDKLINDIKLLARQNSRLFKDSDMTIKYNSLLDDAELAKNNVELSTLRTQLGSFRSELKVTGNDGMTMTDALKSGLTKILQLFGSHGVIVQFTAQLRNAWAEAKELDKAMTDLSRVNSEITRSGFPDYLDRVISKTKELSVAAKDYIDAVTTFSRAGYNLTDSEILSDMSVQLMKVGDMDAESASKALLSGLQGYAEIDGYGMDQLAEKAQALNDKIDILGNTASITQSELAQGIQAVGSVMSDANTSVDEFLSLLAAGNRSVQDSNKVALAIRTSALRIRGCTTELQEMGETTDDVIESTSTLAEKIKALTNVNGSGGVDILEADEKTFRSIYDIYNDISKVYSQMSDTDASALLDLIAGKNRSNQVSAVLQNMSEANVLLERSLSAAGTASAEYEIYLASAEAASERFGVAMTETYNNILNGETVKGLTNAGTAVLDFANSWNLLEGTLRGFLALGILKGITTLTVAFKNSAVQLSSYGKALNAVKNLNTYAQGTTNYAKALNTLKGSCVNLTDAQLKQVLANRNLSNAQLAEILQLKNLKKKEIEARLSQLGLIQTTEAQTAAQGAATASTFSLKAAVTGLGASIKAAFLSNPIGIIIMAVSTAIGVVTSAVSKYKETLEKVQEETKETIETFKSVTSEVENLENKISDLNEQIGKLDPITDAEDLENLKAETAELETQLAILKEKQRIAGSDADKAAQESLGMTQASKYKIEERESVYGGVEVGAAYVTKDEELLNAMEAYDEYKVKVDEANKTLADMAKTGDYTQNQWNEQEQIISRYSKKMDDARSHANELADTLIEQKQGLNGSTEASQELLNTIDGTIAGYNEWLNAINGTTTGLENESSKINGLIDVLNNSLKLLDSTSSATLFTRLTNSEEALDKFQSSVKSAYDAYSTLLSGNYSSSDLLDSIQEISQSVSEMGGTINWEFLDSWGDSLNFVGGQKSSLALLGDVIDDVSKKYAESVLSGAGIDVDSKFGQMLANNIIQAQKASMQLDSLNSNIDSLQSAYGSLTDIVETYNETGSVTFDQLQTLLAMEPQYLNCLIDENGQLQLNEQAMVALANQRLNDAEAQAIQQAITELGQLALQDEKNAVQENGQAFANAVNDLALYNQELGNTIAESTVGAAAIRDLNGAINGAESQGASDEQIDTVLDNLNAKLQAIGSVRDKINNGGLGGVLGNGSKSKTSKSEKDLWLEEYKRKLKELENMRDKGIINEREFFDQSEILLNTYLKDSQAHIEKYEEEISDAEKQLHDDWNAAYDSDAENLKKWQEKKLINMAEYYQSMMNLQDEYYNSEALKLKNLADRMDAEYGRMGNVNLKNRPQVDAATMQSAGWTEFDGDYGTVYSQTYSFDDDKQIVVTPILPDGTVLSPEQLDEYV